MSLRVSRRVKVVRTGLVVGTFAGLCGVLVLTLLAACSSDSGNVGPGGSCFSASDCDPGLICIPQKNSTDRICSSDLTTVTGTPEDMPDGSMREATVLDSPAFDGTTDDDTGSDTGTPDTGPKDSGADG